MLTISAPAKINLHLAVGKKRPDGFHRISSIFCSLDFGDTLHFEYADRDSVELTPSSQIDPEKNSVYQAMALFKKQTGFSHGIRVVVEKRIPVGAGLGGSSSDAAMTLHVLNGLIDRKVSASLLQKMAEELGSDVPFFLYGGTAWVAGRGERITGLPPMRDLSVVLIYPGFQSATAEAFRLLDTFRGQSRAPYRPPPSLAALNGCPAQWSFYNDFLPVFLHSDPHAHLYHSMIQELGQSGADFSGLSGSGSTCFGIFVDRSRAEQAADSLSRHWDFVQLCSVKH
jgi:4-diphosphocytidyl-2-C-methyl-D-erythritol kinase